MKRYYTLLSMEFSSLFPPLCVLIAIMTVIEAILFGLALWSASGEAPFAYLVDSSGLPFVFVLSFAALLVLVVLRFTGNYAPSKSIYALLTLPVKKSRVYNAKLAAALLAGFCVVAVQLVLLLIALAAYEHIPVTEVQPIVYRGEGKSSILYLALLNSHFLRLLIPPDAFSLAFSISILCGAVCLVLSASAQARAGRTARVIVTAAIWVLLMLVTFPLAERDFFQSVIKLIALVVFPFAVSIMGSNVFKSGEVAA